LRTVIMAREADNQLCNYRVVSRSSSPVRLGEA
jgi:hypothetical protein